MEIKELETRIEKVTLKIAKIERLLLKYAKETTQEFVEICDRYFANECKDYSEIKEWKLRNNVCFCPDYYSKSHDLYDAKNTLAKYQKQMIVEQDKQNTLNDLPQVVVEFKNNLIKRWNEFDKRFREFVSKRYDQIWNLYENGERDEYRRQYRDLRSQCGRLTISETIHQSDDEINKQNTKDANQLVLNMIQRVIDKTGKIVDCKGLMLDRDNQGYSIINGIVIGEKGKAIIESIGAGGYNIQRYHIRVLVK